ncbi:hypothetical protein DLJ58_15520 [Micromonospora arida]|uniref:Uncharacterized protein n=1 Tax=Micromonospora arida TaxID=2203715 RepID=A0A3N9X876_9ACTN|nr:hypothetical protein DLJ58_15520 [Micromonospora arida]
MPGPRRPCGDAASTLAPNVGRAIDTGNENGLVSWYYDPTRTPSWREAPGGHFFRHDLFVQNLDGMLGRLRRAG